MVDVSPEAKTVLFSLNKKCEEALQSLRELTVIHAEMNATGEWSAYSDQSYWLRVHKAALHINTVASWQMDDYTFHLMAPDIRAAALALDPIAKRILSRPRPNDRRNRRQFLVGAEGLAHFVHPSPALLTTFTRAEGGLRNAEYVLYLWQAYLCLADLALMFGHALWMAAEAVGSTQLVSLEKTLMKYDVAKIDLDTDALLKVIDE